MASVITPEDLGTDQNNENGQGPNSTTQAGQQSSTTSNVNQAGQAPVQNQSAGTSSTSNSGSTNTGQSAGQSAGNQSTGSSNAGTAGANNQYNPNKQQGSGYTNIQNFVNANKGNQLGSAIGNNIQQTESSAQSNLANAQNTFNTQTQANQANTQANQQLVQNVLNNPTAYANIAGATGSSAPTAANSQAGQQFTNLLSGQYQGPTALTNASQLQNQAANVAQMGQALQTSGGQQGLLQQLVGNPQYTQGQAGLDSLLLGQSNSPALQAAKRGALTLQGQTNSAVTGAAAQGQQNAAQAQQFGTALQNQLGQTVTNENNQLQQAATNDQNQRNQQYQSALADLQSGNINQNEAQLLGLTEGENVYNVLNGNGGTGLGSNSAAQFLTENPLTANISNTANAQQYAQMQALQSLAGQYAPATANTAFQNFQNPSQASSYQNSQALIGNQASLQNAISAAATNYGSIYNPAQNSANMANQIASDWTNTSLGNMGARQAAVAALTNGTATQGDISQNYNWALANQQTQDAALAAVQAQLQNQYGNLGTINIQPQASAYPGIASATGSS